MANGIPDDDVEETKKIKSYWKPSEMPEGETRFRVVQEAIAGWIDWKDKKPYRYRLGQQPSTSFDEASPMKKFWCLYVWDYVREGLFILEIQQATIQNALRTLSKDSDWGDLKKYDIKITKTGFKESTKYIVNPLAPKPLNDKIKDALIKSPVCLEALYAGGNPWVDFQYATTNSANIENASPLEQLKLRLLDADVGIDYVDSYIEDLAINKKCTAEQIIESALLPNMFERFKNAYVKAMLAQQAA